MKKTNTIKAITFIIIGTIMTLFWAWNLFVGGTWVSPADKLQCEKIVQEKYVNSPKALDIMLPKCGEPGMVAMMKASQANASAQVAAKNIASANMQGHLTTFLGSFCLGFGVVLLLAGILIFKKKHTTSSIKQ